MKRKIIGFGIIGVLCLCILLVVIVKQGDKTSTKDSPTEDLATETEQEVQFPYVLEENRLQILSLFQSTISNPDSDGSYVEDLASLEITNCSSEHLQEAVIKVVLETGEELRFVLEDIPANKTVWVFETDNKCYDTKLKVREVKCEAVFAEKTVLLEEQLQVKAEDTLVTVTNASDAALENLELEFHCLFEDVYYGGKTYKYHLDTLGAGETTSIDVWECYLGIADFVNIEH